MERTASCPSCKRAVFGDDAFCSGCGTPLRSRDARTGASRRSLVSQTVPTGERATCGSCHGPVLPGSVFCSTCGARTQSEETPGGESSDAVPRRVTAASQGKYEYVGTLGRGGMGMVFTARDVELERLVAIKVLSPSWLADPSMVERFQREARTIASLRHESIVNVYEVGRADELYYFVMDFIEGVPLSRVLRRFGPLPIPAVQAVFYQVASALAYAHRPDRKIVHRDVKPSNIMLDPEGRATLMDFGIAKVSESPSGLTKTGLVIGTPEYMSPEQCRGHTVTVESDQYSLGTVLYAMLTGAPPFTGPFYQVLMAHQNDAVPPIREVRPDCPADLAAATERMLAKVPGERWPGIRDALRALGLHPLPPDDPVLREIGRMVLETQEASTPGGETGTDSEGRGRTATSIRVEPLPSDVEVGDDLRLNATVLFADGGEDPDLDVSWESTDPGIIRVDNNTGEMVALAPGRAILTAVGAGVSQSVAVDVRPPQVARLDLEPRELALEVGQSLRVQARPLSKRDRLLEREVSWSSSDPRTVRIAPDGTATAERAGVVSVLAHCEGVGAAATLRVSAPATAPAEKDRSGERARETPAGPPPATADPDTAGLAAGVLAAIGSLFAAQRRRWVLGLPAVATVVFAGVWLLMDGPGAGPLVDDLVVLGPEGAQVQEEGLGLRPGDTVALGARRLDAANGEVREGPPVQWSSSDPAVARIDPSGLLVALAEGSARITAAAGAAEREVPVSVRLPERAVVVHRPGNPDATLTDVEVAVGGSTELSATILEDGEPVPESVWWSSSDPSIATVTDEGLVTGRRAGVVELSVAGRYEEARLRVSVPTPAPPSAPATPEEAAPTYGILEIQVRPWAWVYVDDVLWGQERQGRLRLTLEAGRHRIRLDAPNYEPFDTIVDVRDGGRATIRKSLSGSGG